MAERQRIQSAHDVYLGFEVAGNSKCDIANRSATAVVCPAELRQCVVASRAPRPIFRHICGVSGHARANPLAGVARETATTVTGGGRTAMFIEHKEDAVLCGITSLGLRLGTSSVRYNPYFRHQQHDTTSIPP